MKKYIRSFLAFCLVFVLSLGGIYLKANPTTTLPEIQDVAWRGHVENSQGTYNGTILNDMFSGQGDFDFLSGESYTGEWSDSYMSGSGEVVFPNIGKYTGGFFESKRSGQGSFKWETGAEYIGNWENDAMSGDGEYRFENGCVFVGTFANNKPVEGTLKYTASNVENLENTDIIELTYVFSSTANTVSFRTKGELSYSGDASGLYTTGKASIKYPSGNTYEGDVLAGKRNGTGKYVWKDESGKTIAYYEGAWSDDHMNGQGKYHYSNTEYPYLQGTFVNDIPDGKLTYYKEAGNTFETTWSNGNCTSVKET